MNHLARTGLSAIKNLSHLASQDIAHYGLFDKIHTHPLHFTARDLRRTEATWAYQRTKDIVGISRMLGHSDLATTPRYLGIDQNNLKAITDAVDEVANLGKKLGNNSEITSSQKSQNDLKINTI